VNTSSSQDTQTLSALKGLVLDGVDAAQSGHPGGALGCMDFAYLLFTETLRFDPQDPHWLGRDRFILSAGHMSMLQYSLLHGMGWLEREDLARFRQLHSRTPGHPEVGVTPGVECTTGPLGQGCAMSVGFAVAAAHLAATVDKTLFDTTIWTILGDGCMQECVTLSSASFAGHQRLSNLVWFYDQNHKQIAGDISRAYSDDAAKVFEGFGWETLSIDGHDHGAIRKALAYAKGPRTRPLLIIGTTIMAKGAYSLEGSHHSHGAPFSKEELKQTKSKLGLAPDESFQWPAEVGTHFQRNFPQRGEEANTWKQQLEIKRKDAAFEERWNQHFGEGNKNPRFSVPSLIWDRTKELATRQAFGKVLEHWAKHIPALVGGSADLDPSNMTEGFATLVRDFTADNRAGRNLAFGVREFAMSAIANGIALHGGLIPFDATFLSFADYSRPALRLGAIQQVRVLHEFSHDSFYLGEDGPTHQPVEHLMSLRAIPELYVMRPADPHETEMMCAQALALSAPSCICVTRQKVPHLPKAADEARRGAWVVKEAQGVPELLLFATGSEVGLALETAAWLESQGIYEGPRIQVVSVPCWELFFTQEASYQAEILQPACKNRVSIEAGATLGWERFVGQEGLMIGLDHYGASAPAPVLAELYGFTPQAIGARIRTQFGV